MDTLKFYQDGYNNSLVDIQNYGIRINNILDILYALAVIEKTIDNACWFQLDDSEVTKLKQRWILLARRTGIDYTEDINEIYTNVNRSQSNVEFQRYIDSITKYKLKNGIPL